MQQGLRAKGMADQNKRSASPSTLMLQMGLDDADIERRMKIVGFEPTDLVRIAAIKDLVTQRVEDHVTTFFNHLLGLEEARSLFADRAVVERARELKRAHVMAMVQGDYGKEYVEQRLELGCLYAAVGVEPRAFLGAFHVLLTRIGSMIMEKFERTPKDGFENFVALKKIAFLDIGIIVDMLVFERERVIRHQEEAIRELSTPVLLVRPHLLLLPIVGAIDTKRARIVTDGLLHSIRVNRAKIVVMDVTGIAGLDSKVAKYLLDTVSAARLMGAIVIVTGLTHDVAVSLDTLGVDLSVLNVMGDLQGGLEEAERMLGQSVGQLLTTIPADSGVGNVK